PVAGQALHGGDGRAAGPPRRIQAAVHGSAVDVHGAGAAVAGVAALLDAEVAAFAQVGAQALAGAGLLGVLAAVDLDAEARHASSSRISSAARTVTCRRQSPSPCTSTNHSTVSSIAAA